MNYFSQYLPLADIFLLALGFAFSQQVVLRAGVFSVATAGFASLGAYCSAILVTTYGWPAPVAIATSLLFGTAAGWCLSLPLARLRGIYQAIATLAFVQVVIAVMLFATSITGGGLGINSIPKSVGTGTLLAAAVITGYIMYAMQRSGVGRAFDAIQQEETVAAVLGVSIRRYHSLAFTISGAIAGLFGGLQSLNTYTLTPGSFSFTFVIMVLGYIVVGGRRSVWGPVVGVAFLTLLPELSRGLAEYRPIVTGVVMIAVMIFLPLGLADTFILSLKRRKRRGNLIEGGNHVRSAS